MKNDDQTSSGSVTLKFFYLKSTQFRTLHVDGAIGGITPRGGIHMAVYSERPAIPQVQTHQLSPEGRLGEPTEIEGKEGIVRELDVDFVMSKRTATEMRDWLTKTLEQLDELEGSPQKDKPEGKKNV